jgi:hypothetical protein
VPQANMAAKAAKPIIRFIDSILPASCPDDFFC